MRRTFCSWDDAGWRSLLVQCFDHAPEAQHVQLPGVSDLHLVLYVAGDVVMRTRSGGKPVRGRRVPGALEIMVPGRETVRDYRAAGMRTIQVHVPAATVARAAARLGGSAPDFEALSAEVVAVGDPVVEHLVRALPAAGGPDDVYAESAAEFRTTHLLTKGRHERLPGPEHAAVRTGIAVMHDRLAEPLTLADIAAEAHLSVYHFVRVFRAATGETPYRYLTRLRIQRTHDRADRRALWFRQPRRAVDGLPGTGRRPAVGVPQDLIELRQSGACPRIARSPGFRVTSSETTAQPSSGSSEGRGEERKNSQHVELRRDRDLNRAPAGHLTNTKIDEWITGRSPRPVIRL